MKLTYRVLDPSEYGKIPVEAIGGQTLPAGNSLVVAAMAEAGAVVGVWCAVAVVHLEPLWVRSDYRNSARLLPRLWATLKAALQSHGVKNTLCIVSDSVPVSAKIAAWCGARPVAGKLYQLLVDKETACFPE